MLVFLLRFTLAMLVVLLMLFAKLDCREVNIGVWPWFAGIWGRL
jgi:hypothetical protein